MFETLSTDISGVCFITELEAETLFSANQGLNHILKEGWVWCVDAGYCCRVENKKYFIGVLRYKPKTFEA